MTPGAKNTRTHQETLDRVTRASERQFLGFVVFVVALGLALAMFMIAQATTDARQRAQEKRIEHVADAVLKLANEDAGTSKERKSAFQRIRDDLAALEAPYRTNHAPTPNSKLQQRGPE